MPEEELDIVINARDYATETLHGITGTVRSLGMSVTMATSNFAMLTKELGIQIPFLEGINRAFHTIGIAIRAAGAAMRVYELLTKSATIAEWAHAAALAIKAHLMAIASAGVLIPAMIAAGATAAALVAGAMAQGRMERGGIVAREGLYYLHAGETVTPAASYSTSSVVQYIRVSLDRPVLRSDADVDEVVDTVARRIALAARQRGG